MKRITRTGIFLAAAWLGLAGAAAASELEAEAGPLQVELARLNQALAKIATLLERQVAAEALSFAASRADVTSQRVLLTQRELERLRDQQTGLERQRRDMQQQLELLAERVALGQTDISDQDVEMMTADYERSLRNTGDELRQLALRIGEREAALIEQEREADRWHDTVQQRVRDAQ